MRHNDQMKVRNPEIRPEAVLEVCLCHNLRRATRAVSRAYDAALAPLGLSASQFAVLCAIAASHPGVVTALAETLSMDRTTLSRTIKPLRENGYLRISAGAGRRPDSLFLTPEGRAVVRDGSQLWRTAQTSLSGRLGSAHAGQLLASIAAVLRAAAPL